MQGFYYIYYIFFYTWTKFTSLSNLNAYQFQAVLEFDLFLLLCAFWQFPLKEPNLSQLTVTFWNVRAKTLK